MLGNTGGGFQGYGFTDAARHPCGTPGIPRSAFAISLLKPTPEHAQTLEVGYKGMILPKLYADGSYFRSQYTDFIGGRAFVGNVDGSRPSQPQLDDGLPSWADRSKPTRFIFSWYNSPQLVRTQAGCHAGPGLPPEQGREPDRQLLAQPAGPPPPARRFPDFF